MTQPRQPKGVPTGGQFAASRHDEASVELREDMDESLHQTIARIADDLHSTVDPFDRCEEVSRAVTCRLRDAGYDARWVQLAGAPRSLSDTLPNGSPWRSIPPEHWNHYATLVDGRCVDLTFGQFDPEASYPYSFDPTSWERRFGITDVLPGDQAKQR